MPKAKVTETAGAKPTDSGRIITDIHIRNLCDQNGDTYYGTSNGSHLIGVTEGGQFLVALQTQLPDNSWVTDTCISDVRDIEPGQQLKFVSSGGRMPKVTVVESQE